MIDYTLIWTSLHSLWQGTLITILITVIAAMIGFSLGTVFAFAKHSLKNVVSIYVLFFRGTPMLVQILFVYYVLPQMGVDLPPFWAASIAIGLNSAAYICEIVRTGMNGVSYGQIEAAQTLGLSSWMTKRYIVFPQAFRIALPAIGNELITLVKDSSLASIIGVMELTKEASIIRSRTYDAFSILLAVACIYLLLTMLISIVIKKMERHYA